MLLGTLYLALVSASVTFQPMAFTYHGYIQQDELKTIRQKGNTLDDEGRLTFHTGAGVTVKWKYAQLQSIYFRNSFDQHSGALMGGPKFDFGKYLSLGLVFGAYVRTFIEGMHIPFSWHNDKMEVAPMAMVTGSFAFKIYKSFFFEVNVGSNYILNFVTPGIRVNF